MDENDSVTKEEKRKFNLATEKLKIVGSLAALNHILDTVMNMIDSEENRLEEINIQLSDNVVSLYGRE